MLQPGPCAHLAWLLLLLASVHCRLLLSGHLRCCWWKLALRERRACTHTTKHSSRCSHYNYCNAGGRESRMHKALLSYSNMLCSRTDTLQRCVHDAPRQMVLEAYTVATHVYLAPSFSSCWRYNCAARDVYCRTGMQQHHIQAKSMVSTDFVSGDTSSHRRKQEH